MQIEKLSNSGRDLTFKKAFETAKSMELANREDFRGASVPVDDTVNKVGKYASPGHSNEEDVSCFRCSRTHSPSWC